MPDKQPTHKPISVRIETYEAIQQIAEQLTTEKGVPVSIPSAVQLLVEEWQRKTGDA